MRKVGGRREGIGLRVDDDDVSIEKRGSCVSSAFMRSLRIKSGMKGWLTYR